MYSFDVSLYEILVVKNGSMVDKIEKLNSEDYESLKQAVPMVAILIAGADGVIDSDEKEWAQKGIELKQIGGSHDLHTYYEAVAENFEDRFKAVLSNCPEGTEKRQEYLVSELAKLNDVLHKLNRVLAEEFLESLRLYAKQVANASGGFLAGEQSDLRKPN